MNERIRELLEQSLRWSGENVNRNLYSVYEIQQKEYEKFAELIVRECVNVALEQKKLVEDQEVFNPHDESWNRARIQQSQRIVEKITQHFGVEE